MTTAAPTAGMAAGNTARTPGLRRRLAAFVYEGMLLFGVLMLADYLFAALTQQRHALQQRELGMVFLFLVLGVYFSWFWSHGGQTLAMKTWQIRLQRPDGAPVSQARAAARYAASWVWFLPPLALIQALGVARLGGTGSAALLLAWLAGYALLSRLHPQRQFWHDVWCDTRLVDTRPPPA